MRNLLPSGRRRLALQLLAAGSLATLMSGCSSDVTRLTDPFSNPFASNDEAPAAAAPVRPRHVASADIIPAGRMPPVSSQALAPRPAPNVATNYGISRETTGSIEPGAVRMAAGSSYGNWTTSGGTPVVVAEGENADILAQRYGVPASALLQVNGLHAANEIRPGTHVTIPVYSASAARVAQAPKKVEERRVAPPVHQSVAAVRTAPERVAEAPAKWVAGPAPARTASAAAPGRVVTAQAAPAAPTGHVRPGKETKPVATAKVAAAPAPKAAPLQKVAVAKLVPAAPAAIPAAPAPKTIVKSAPVAAAKLPAAAEAPKVAVEPTPMAPAPAAATASADNNPEFRWPARGRIIQAFKGGSGGNDGINIAVPEGTPVKAAEGGVVAYAGSELKGYGNLVLIRHPNGFVSAYANNGTIDVKKGETVKRGQEIAKSGQSGNVSSPQLHFELRKGSTPVDPTQYLAGL